MATRVATFHDDDGLRTADTCQPLRDACAAGRVDLRALVHGAYPGTALPRGTLRELRSAGYWDARGDQRWGLDWHVNEGVELTYLARGRLAFAVDERSYDLRRGSLTVTRPWQRHRVGDPEVTASRLCWLILDVGVRRPHQPWRWPKWLVLAPAELERLTRLLRHNEQPVWHAGADIHGAFERLAELVSQPFCPAVQTRLTLHVNELLVALLDLLDRNVTQFDQSLSTAHRSVEMFLRDLAAHVERHWTLDSMAAHCGLGRSRFSHYCRAITNLTPIQYLQKCRVERARAMLESHGDLHPHSITDIAARCGFDSSQYFATVFRRLTGQSPRQYRQAMEGSSTAAQRASD